MFGKMRLSEIEEMYSSIRRWWLERLRQHFAEERAELEKLRSK